MTAYLRACDIGLELPLDIHNGGRTGALRAALSSRERVHRRILSDVDFTASEGDRIGLLGLNGAGKTTLLRVLNGAFPPTRGRVERNGTVQSLLNPVLGFDEHATVVENAYLRGTAMGLRRAQLHAALDEILAFAGLEAKAGHPLHTLSAGQRMRLGFAISTAVQPDILLMDEWLSTGDAAFIDRAQQRMRSRFQGARIVVIASHSPALVRILCNKALVLDEGRMRFFGEVDAALDDYRALVSQASAAMRQQVADLDPLLFGDPAGVVERIRVEDAALEIVGWAVHAGDREAPVLCVELDGHRHCFDAFERVDREDVRLHLGRRQGRFGFRLTVSRAQGAIDPRAVRVSVGASTEEFGPPLPFAMRGVVEIA